MTRVIHEHMANDTDSSNSMGIVLGLIVVAIFAIVVFYMFANGRFFNGSTTPQVNVPVPDKVDVNLNK